MPERDEAGSEVIAKPSARYLMTGAAPALALVVAAIVIDGGQESGARQAIRLTARLSFVLFMLSYAADAFPQDSRPSLRQLFSSFAASHIVHLGAIVWLALVAIDNPFASPALIGVIGYAFLIAAFVGSFSDIWRAKAGFERFHNGASHVVWIVFMLTLAGLASEGHVRGFVLGAVGMLALGARLWGRRASTAGPT